MAIRTRAARTTPPRADRRAGSSRSAVAAATIGFLAVALAAVAGCSGSSPVASGAVTGPTPSPSVSSIAASPFTVVGQTASRYNQSSTVLTDGRVLVAGGCCAANSAPLDSAELYDPKTGQFTPTGSMTSGRTSQAAVLLSDGRVLIVGGVGDDTAEIYDPARGAFHATGKMTVPRSGATTILLKNGRVLVIGGSGFADAELYDPVPAPSPRPALRRPSGSRLPQRCFQTAWSWSWVDRATPRPSCTTRRLVPSVPRGP